MKNSTIRRMLALVCILITMVSLGAPAAQADASSKSTTFTINRGQWANVSLGTYSEPVMMLRYSGSLTFDYGGEYTGIFSGANPNGDGTYTYANGDTISGSFGWTDGISYHLEQGTEAQPVIYSGTKMVYTGMTLDGIPAGFGALDFLDGGTFYGEFRDGTVKGKGVYVFRESNGSESVTGSKWNLVRRISSSLGGRWYTGLRQGSTWQGYGMLCYDNCYYIGEVLDNYCSGHGTYYSWAKKGDPSGVLTCEKYGHYSTGSLQYACTHSSKDGIPASVSTLIAASDTNSKSKDGGKNKNTTPSEPQGDRYCTSLHCSHGFCLECSGTGRRPCPRKCLNGSCPRCLGRGEYYSAGKTRHCECGFGQCGTCYGQGDVACYYCDNGRCRICGGDGKL